MNVGVNYLPGSTRHREVASITLIPGRRASCPTWSRERRSPGTSCGPGPGGSWNASDRTRAVKKIAEGRPVMNGKPASRRRFERPRCSSVAQQPLPRGPALPGHGGAGADRVLGGGAGVRAPRPTGSSPPRPSGRSRDSASRRTCGNAWRQPSGQPLIAENFPAWDEDHVAHRGRPTSGT